MRVASFAMRSGDLGWESGLHRSPRGKTKQVEQTFDTAVLSCVRKPVLLKGNLLPCESLGGRDPIPTRKPERSVLPFPASLGRQQAHDLVLIDPQLLPILVPLTPSSWRQGFELRAECEVSKTSECFFS